MRKVTITPEQEAYLRASWLSETVRMDDICSRLNCSKRTVRVLARNLDLGARRLPDSFWTKARWEEVRRLYVDEALGTDQIAKRLGVTANMVRSKLDRMGVLKRRERPTLAVQRVATAKIRAERVQAVSAPVMPAPRKAIASPPPKRVADDDFPTPVLPPIAADTWAPLPGVRPVTLMDRQLRMCCWPVSVEDVSEHLFCGARIERDHTNWCPVHDRMGRQPGTGDDGRRLRVVDRDIATATPDDAEPLDMVADLERGAA